MDYGENTSGRIDRSNVCVWKMLDKGLLITTLCHHYRLTFSSWPPQYGVQTRWCDTGEKETLDLDTELLPNPGIDQGRGPLPFS